MQPFKSLLYMLRIPDVEMYVKDINESTCVHAIHTHGTANNLNTLIEQSSTLLKQSAKNALYQFNDPVFSRLK